MIHYICEMCVKKNLRLYGLYRIILILVLYFLDSEVYNQVWCELNFLWRGGEKLSNADFNKENAI